MSLQNAILRTVMLQPVPLMLFAAVYLVEKDELQSGNALWLVIAAQFVIAAVVWSILWVFFCLVLWGVPVLWMSHPNMSLWKVPMLAVRVLCGGIWELVGMLLWYSVQMLPLVTIPWVLPRAILSVTAFFHIRLQTWEETHSKNPHYFALICSTVGK